MVLYFTSGRRETSLFGEVEREVDSRFRQGITVSMSARRVVHCAGVKYVSEGGSGRATVRGVIAWIEVDVIFADVHFGLGYQIRGERKRC